MSSPDPGDPGPPGRIHAVPEEARVGLDPTRGHGPKTAWCRSGVAPAGGDRRIPAEASYGCFRRAFRADRKITRSWRCRVTSHPEILASWTFQHYVLGTATVWRIGFGAMQLPGPGVFGPPRDAIQIRGYRDDVICRARPPGSAG